MLTREETAKAILPYIGRNFTVTKKVSDPYNMLCTVGSIVKISPILIQLILEGEVEGVAHLQNLSAITDEHAVEVAKILYPYFEWSHCKEESLDSAISPCVKYIYSNQGFILELYRDLSHNITSGEIDNGRLHIVFQYLISKGYAVPLFFGIDHPCNGKTAIDLGIAIIKQ